MTDLLQNILILILLKLKMFWKYMIVYNQKAYCLLMNLRMNFFHLKSINALAIMTLLSMLSGIVLVLCWNPYIKFGSGKKNLSSWYKNCSSYSDIQSWWSKWNVKLQTNLSTSVIFKNAKKNLVPETLNI